MANDFNTNTKNNDEWLTPLNIIEGLGEFDLDPCSPIVRPWDTAAKHYNINDNGFNQPWEGRVWCNPPYGRETFKWIDKLATHGNGTALIFARTETIGFHEHIWNRADAIFFFKGRIKFHYVDGIQGGPANAPSCLVAYGKENVKKLLDFNVYNGYCLIL
jgi:DNA N-6-adenine-methyltransferase (Dam)